VVQGADEIIVTLPESGVRHEARVIVSDRSTDVALLKIDGVDFPRATLADSDQVQVGDVVLAVGNPFELDQTVTQGIVSAKGRSNVAPQGFYGSFIQTDAAINPGNSGGALVDSSGRVIGINTMIYSTSGGSTGIGFAIPINMAIRVIRDLLDNGRVSRGYLGVVLNDLSPAMARRLRQRDRSGVLVGPVIQGSPADRAGMQQYDVIVSVEGRRVTDSNGLRTVIGRTPPGSEVTFGVFRDGGLVEIPVTLGEAPNRGGAYVNRGRWERPEGRVEPPAQRNRPFYLEGVDTATLDDSLRAQLGLDATYEGAVVVQVAPTSPAGRRGLQVGDLIVEVGREAVRNVGEAWSAGESVEGDSVILGVIRRGKEEFILVTRQARP
jgi:serine protease Do